MRHNFCHLLGGRSIDVAVIDDMSAIHHLTRSKVATLSRVGCVELSRVDGVVERAVTKSHAARTLRHNAQCIVHIHPRSLPGGKRRAIELLMDSFWFLAVSY